MISVEQALEKILGYVSRLSTERIPIMDTLGQGLAEDITSQLNVPPHDNAAMDGYAVRSNDTSGACAGSPRLLEVIDTVIAGSVSKHEVRPGTAIRIMTGAPVPVGADAVVRFEDTDEEARRQSAPPIKEIGILCPAEPGLNVRLAGEDISAGSTVLKAGTLIRPAEIGVIASLGLAEVPVIRRPQVAILATGNELIELGRRLPPGKIYNSNTYSLAAQVKQCGAVPQVLGVASDNRESLVAGLKQGLSADMVITTGGVSAGDYDMVKNVIAQEGEISFWTVRMKPGKPLAFGLLKGKSGRSVPHLGLPGNPVSSMVTFELFARPAIQKMMGIKNNDRPVIEAVLEGNIANRDGRRVYSRAVVEKRNSHYIARLTGPQGSGILTSMSHANGLVITPEDTTQMRTGDLVSVIMLDWSQHP